MGLYTFSPVGHEITLCAPLGVQYGRRSALSNTTICFTTSPSSSSFCCTVNIHMFKILGLPTTLLRLQKTHIFSPLNPFPSSKLIFLSTFCWPARNIERTWPADSH